MSQRSLLVAVGIGAVAGAMFALYLGDSPTGLTIGGAILGAIIALRRFRVVNILVGLGMIAALVAAVFMPRRGHSRQDIYVRQMRFGLRSLEELQEKYFSKHRTYAASLALLDDGSIRTFEGQVSIDSANARAWAATARHRLVTNTCTLSAQRTAADSAARIIECTDGGFTPAYRVFRDSADKVHAEEAQLDSIVPTAPAACSADSIRPFGRLSLGREELGYPVETLDPLPVRQLLLDRRYDALDTVLAAYADSARRDYRLEYRAFDAYRAFDIAWAPLEPWLDAWVRERPRSANARLVRATYYMAAQFQRAGPDRPRQRVPWQYSRLAKRDILASLEMSPCNIVAYELLMRSTLTTDDQSRRLMEQGLAIQPRSFILRLRHMHNIAPSPRDAEGRFGAMEAFASESDDLAGTNPRLKALTGFAWWSRARRLETQNDSVRALVHYTRAIDAADFWQFRLDRGELYANMGRPAEALADFERAFAQRPMIADVLISRSKAAFYVAKKAPAAERARLLAQAVNDANFAARLDPSDAHIKKWVEYYEGRQ